MYLEYPPCEVVVPLGPPVLQLLQVLLQGFHRLGGQQHRLVSLHAVHEGQHRGVAQSLQSLDGSPVDNIS